MFWPDSSPNYGFLANDETEIEGVLGPWLLDQAVFPDSVINPTILNAADALELETLQELQKTREKEIGLLRRLFQIRAGRSSPPDAYLSLNNRNPVIDSTQEPLPPFPQQIVFSGAENVVTNGSLPPFQFDVAIPNSVRGPSNSDSTLDDSSFVPYGYETASDDRGIHSDGNHPLPSLTALPPVTNNGGETSTAVSLVNQAETSVGRTAAPASESQATKVPVPRSESTVLRSKRLHSVLDLPGFDCFPSNEQASNFHREKRPCTNEERQNIKAVKKLGGACFSCREGKRRVSYISLIMTCADNNLVLSWISLRALHRDRGSQQDPSYLLHTSLANRQFLLD